MHKIKIYWGSQISQKFTLGKAHVLLPSPVTGSILHTGFIVGAFSYESFVKPEKT